MATARVTATPVKPEGPEATRYHPSIEDRVDHMMVRAARVLALRRGIKAVAWSDFKKKLDR